jgi:hypothetical protein
MLRATLMFLLLAQPVLAGPWTRAEGEWFVSLSHAVSAHPDRLRQPGYRPDHYSALLLEYGHSARLTYGIDAGRAAGGGWQALVFAARAIGPMDAPRRLALRLGLGARQSGGRRETLVQLGAAWGEGFETRFGPGWAAADAKLTLGRGAGKPVRQLDLTLGVKPDSGTLLFLQLQTGDYPGQPTYLRVVPSAALEFAPGRHIELGLPVGITGDRRVGVKLGAWLRF